jgi:hypothetical protein
MATPCTHPNTSSAQATRLARLLDRLLEVSRLDAGQLVL